MQRLKLTVPLHGCRKSKHPIFWIRAHKLPFSVPFAQTTSRDRPVFQEVFSQKPTLLLRDLTTQDIEIYVQTEFEQDPGFLQIKEREPMFAEQLLYEVAKRSSGVFLWVRLVVKSLPHGICNGDRISDICTRLGELPQDLESLSRKSFDSMEPRYRQHAVELFQIHRAHGSIRGLRSLFRTMIGI